MAKCVNCAWFPWKPGADFSGLPAMRCHPKLAARRWSKVGAEVETSCPLYKVAEFAEEVVEDKAASVQIVSEAAEVPVEKKPKVQTKTKSTSTKSATKTKKTKPGVKSKTAKKE